MSHYLVKAEFPGAGEATESVCCFDPRIVLSRMRAEFGDRFESDLRDLSRKDVDHFQSRIDQEGETEGLVGCRRVARNDAMRRGPIFRFTIHWEGELYGGRVERYLVELQSQERPLPESLWRRFKSFLERLPLAPFEVRAVKLDGNTETDLDG